MRLSRADWVRAGLTHLRDHGPQALTIERLCAALGVSKGSFYHHFRNLGAYHAALLDRWVQDHTQAPIEQSALAPVGQARLDRLGALVRDLDHALDLAVRRWSFDLPEVRARVAEVDARRVDALTALYRDLGDARPERRARATYAGLVGAQFLGCVEDWAAQQASGDAPTP